MTEQELRKLPGLLTRTLFMEVTGLSERDITELVKDGDIKVYKPNGKYGKYYKQDALRLISRPG